MTTLGTDDQGGLGLAESAAQTPPPETTAPEAPEPVAAPSPSPEGGLGDPPSDGQPRDEQGRFAPKGADAPPTDPNTPPDVAGVGAPAGSSASPSAPVDTRSPHETPAPLTYRAGGREHIYPGAERMPDGSIVLKPDVHGRILNDLAAAHTYHTTWRDTLARTKQEAQHHVEQATAKAQGFEAVAERLFAELEPLMDAREFQLLARELSIDLTQRGALQPQRGTASLPAPGTSGQASGPDPDQIRFQAQQTLVDEVLTRVQHDPAFNGLATDEATRNDLLNFFLETLPAYFAEQEGEVVLDTHKVKFALQREAAKIQATQQAKEAAAKEARELKAALERNAAKDKKPDLPATVGTRTTATPTAGSPQFKNREEWEAYRRSYGMS